MSRTGPKYTDTEQQDALIVDEVFSAIRRGELAQARELAEDVASRGPSPDDYESAYEEAGVFYQRYWDDAERDFYDSVLAQLDDPPEVSWLRCAYPRACFALGFLAVQDGDLDTGIPWLMAADQYDPSNPTPKIELATVATGAGDHETSLALYEQAMESRPLQPPWIVARILRGRGFNFVGSWIGLMRPWPCSRSRSTTNPTANSLERKSTTSKACKPERCRSPGA